MSRKIFGIRIGIIIGVFLFAVLVAGILMVWAFLSIPIVPADCDIYWVSNTYALEGVVTNQANNQPLVDAQISVQVTRSSGEGICKSPPIIQDIKSATSDINGEFKISNIEAFEINSFQITVTTGNCQSFTTQTRIEQLTSIKAKDFQLYIPIELTCN